MENSTRHRGVTRNGSSKSAVSAREKGPINISDALSRLPRKVRSIERVELPPDPELEKSSPTERVKQTSRPPSSKREEAGEKVREPSKLSKPPSKGITVEEILRQDDELSRVSRAENQPQPAAPMKQDIKNVLSRLSPSRQPEAPRKEPFIAKTTRPRETLSRDSRVQSRFGDLLEKSRTFNHSRPAPALSRIDDVEKSKFVERTSFREEKQPIQKVLLPIIRERNKREHVRSAEIVKERVDESRTTTRSKSYPNKESVEQILRQLQEEKYDIETQRHILEQEKEEFERMQNEIVDNLRQKNDELENRLQELMQREKHLSDEAEKSAQRRKTIAADYEFRLKIKEYETKYKIEFPDDIEECVEIVRRLALYERKVTFRRTARRLFIFFVIVIEFLLTDLLGIDISDFAEDQVKMINDYDSAFDQLSEIWFGSGPGISPQMKIMLLFTFNMFMFITGKYAVKMVGDNYSGMVDRGKGFVKDFISVSFLPTDNMNAATGNFELDAMLGALKVKRTFDNMGEPTKEHQKPKGPAYQN